jgi:hypothetical protein
MNRSPMTAWRWKMKRNNLHIERQIDFQRFVGPISQCTITRSGEMFSI